MTPSAEIIGSIPGCSRYILGPSTTDEGRLMTVSACALELVWSRWRAHNRVERFHISYIEASFKSGVIV